ncbi:hypothetical protein, partial [Salmonella enterica]|uniref:hypothetical protein n=1 Tax=Salmonella enterica TaxID=28901 RepID=UPI0022B5EE94
MAQARRSETDANQQLQELRDALIQLAADLKAQQERVQALSAEQQTLDARLGEWRALHPQLDNDGLTRLL